MNTITHPTASPFAPRPISTALPKPNAGTASFAARSRPINSAPPSDALELVMWQLAARGIQLVWLFKPFLWIGIISYFLAVVAGYYMASVGLF